MNDIPQKPEWALSNVFWILIGPAVGAFISLCFEYLMKSRFQPKACIEIRASSKAPENADFLTSNIGNAIAEDVRVVIWAAAPLASRTDVSTVEHTGGTTDASANDFGIHEARMTGNGIRLARAPVSLGVNNFIIKKPSIMKGEFQCR